jgi:hypothetical protein
MLGLGLVLAVCVQAGHVGAAPMLGEVATSAAPRSSQEAVEVLREQVARDGWVRVRVDLHASGPGTAPAAAGSPAIREDDLEHTMQDVLFAMPLGSYKNPQRETHSTTLTLQVDAAGLDALLVAPAIAAVVAAEPPEMRRIAAGSLHSLAIKSDGSLWAWGQNNDGQLGAPTIVASFSPVQVHLATGVAAVAAGRYHTLALKSDGSLWAWGSNAEGEIGDGTTTKRLSPVQIMTDVAAVAAGAYHSLAIKTDGSLWAWGDNGYGQVGDGTLVRRITQVLVMTDVAAVAAGTYHSLAIKTDGSVWAWGQNSDGRIGDGTTINRSSPVQVVGLTGVAAVAAGGEHTLALKTDGSLWAWGNNTGGRVGDGTTTMRLSPVQVMTGVAAVAARYEHTLARKTDGSLWAWGNNAGGQIGDGKNHTRHTSPFRTRGFSTTASLPKAPSKLTATVYSDARINLSWSDNSADETGFRIERKTGSGDWAEIGQVRANARTFASAGLTAGTAYSYRVRAFNAAGTSAYTNEATATTTGGTVAPVAPSALGVAGISKTQINLRWFDRSSNESGFRIERRTGSGGWTEIGQVGANVRAFTSTGLSGATLYSFRVRAFHAYGTSAYSNVTSAKTR